PAACALCSRTKITRSRTAGTQSKEASRKTPTELERREIARGDRQLGLAAMQYGEVHSHGLHDLDVDTSLRSPRESALRIRDFLPDRPRPTAFETLRRTLRKPD
ncbi:hypothetical protein ACGF5O_48765, partial [Streptomyces sp. NPDC048291]